MEFRFRNVNEAYEYLVTELFGKGNDVVLEKRTSRNGPVVMINEPVTVCYTHPSERVLFHRGRDANPFFHLFESLWMLAGRNDLKPLQYYVSDFDKYSDDGKTLNGAYGHRWCHAECGLEDFEWERQGILLTNQLTELVEHLKKTPDSRRAVLQMWNVKDDLMKIDYSKDVCCNLSVCFSIRAVEEFTGDWDCSLPTNNVRYLDMTVFNRSNDLVFGMLGANVCHFSFLQEYMATRIGVQVGRYYQVSNNLHMYTDNIKEAWKQKETTDPYCCHDTSFRDFQPYPLVKDPIVFDEEVEIFIDNPEGVYKEPFLRDVAVPMAVAYRHHKERNYAIAHEAMHYVAALDWKLAGINWLDKRQSNWEAKQQ